MRKARREIGGLVRSSLPGAHVEFPIGVNRDLCSRLKGDVVPSSEKEQRTHNQCECYGAPGFVPFGLTLRRSKRNSLFVDCRGRFDAKTDASGTAHPTRANNVCNRSSYRCSGSNGNRTIDNHVVV